MALQLTRRRFTIDEYHRMIEAGILGKDDRVELIEGEILEMSPIGRHHASEVLRLTEIFVLTFSDVAQLGPQNPIQLPGNSEPQPDLTLLRRRDDYYDAGLPGPEDALLVVEVADSSMAYDRRLKMPLYGRSGIPEAWLIDVNRKTITIYRNPGPEGYGMRQVVRRGEKIALSAFPHRPLEVSRLLG